ncbi:MAG: ATP-dependent RecD-like DNA helicase [Polyangiaceae bacterium]|nr:ATP-dependent RecD-like DNA helicase [Polyangiaceae bacterium]
MASRLGNELESRLVAITLTGEVERVTYESEETSFRVIRVGSLEGADKALGSVSVVGTFQAVGPGTQVRVTGSFVEDARHGRQFQVKSLVAIAPNTQKGIEKYLSSGLIPGIGPVIAKRIVEKFGAETLKVLDVDPQRLREVPGLGQKRVEDIQKSWTSQRAISNLMLLLQSHGVSTALATRIWKHYGDKSASIVQGSPYRLALQVRGVGFKTADKIAQSLGIVRDHPERAQAGLMHELDALVENGHTFVERAFLVEKAAAMLEIDTGHVEAAVDALWAESRLVVEDSAVFPVRLHQAEVAISEHICRLMAAKAPALPGVEKLLFEYQKTRNITLAEAQQSAVKLVAENKVCIITGGPGVGKTTIIRAVLAVLSKARLKVRLAAPTGRAAKRLSEATGEVAITLHRLLEFEPRLGRFQRHVNNPIEAEAIIVDEASMIDTFLAAALMEAVADNARLVIVGDADQLQSVGPGAVLRDLLATPKLPRSMLHEIFRQAQTSRIVQNAHRILGGDTPESAPADEKNADFFVISRSDAEQAAQLIAELVTKRIPNHFGLDPRNDIRVLTPMHRGPVGTTRLNELLQSLLNPGGPALAVRGQELRLGDKVMQVKNDYQKEVFNGDLGSIIEVDAEGGSLVVDFEGSRVRYEGQEIESLTLAYATSIHKSQGSEYAAVVIPLTTSHYLLLSRNLLYTAVTRAKKLCVVVADPRAMKMALSEVRTGERQTRLAWRLDQALR